MRFHLEILFPHSRVYGLKRLRGKEWQSLTGRITSLPETHPDALAFSYLMIKLCDCLNCDLGSYKAALGCSACSQRTISASCATDKMLLKQFEQARDEVFAYLDSTDASEEMAA